MSSSFFGLNIVIKGLHAQQRALDVTGHNIANVNTEGYSRQRAVMETAKPQAVMGGRGMLGTGADVQEIQRIRDQFLDVKFRGENTALGEWEAKSQVLTEIETVFNEPSDAGLNSVIDQFFSSLQELTKDPGSLTVRSLVRQRAIALTNTLNHMAGQFKKIQLDLNFAIETKVKAVNSYAQQISELNQQIMKYELDGSNANDLRDRRDLLVDRLSKIVDVRTFEDTDGRFRLYIGNRLLVNHNNINKLVLVERGETYKGKTPAVKNPDVDAPGLYEILWDDGEDFNPTGGELKGLIEMRDSDGTSGEWKGVPFYMKQLNYFAETFAAEFNSIHETAYNLTGSNNILFFVNSSTNAGVDITAENISISDEIYQDVNNIAVASSTAGIPGDASKGLELVNLRHEKIFPEYGTPEDFTKSIISSLGVDGQEAIRMRDNQDVLVKQIDISRTSVSGVSIDEEMANMVKYMHSYNAAARMVTAIDEMIEVVVNRLGIVGR